MRPRPAATLLLGAVLALLTAPLAVAAPPQPVDRASNTASLDIEPRLQWNANYGYCGETSLISAGMHFGQYASQWTVRDLASPGVDQTEQESQLLLGVNDLAAATRMRLSAIAYDSQGQRSTPQFLAWVKSQIVRGWPVIIGVLINSTESDIAGPGDEEYDHIVPVLGVSSASRLSAGDRRYRPTDVLVFSDNDGDVPSSIYRPTFRAFQRSRSSANQAGAPMYSLLNHPRNYGIAITGIQDPEHVTIPVRLTSSLDGEGAQEQERLTAPPTPLPMVLTATVTIPDQAVAYRVYAYDDFDKVPISDFNAAAGNAIASWTIPPGAGPTWTMQIPIMSNQTRAFRAVAVTAP